MGSKGTCPVPQLRGQFWQELNTTQYPAKAQQHAHPSHLVLLPELAQDVAVNGVLHKADIEALDAEIEVPKPEHKAVEGREGNRLEGLGSTTGGNGLSLWVASASRTGTLGSTSAGQHSADSSAGCQPCQDSSGRAKHH